MSMTLYALAKYPRNAQYVENTLHVNWGFIFAYMSYALTVALWIVLFCGPSCFDWWGWMAFTFFKDLPFILTTGIVLLALMPVLIRSSRSILLHMFTRNR